MATDLERLIVSLEANLKKYESELARAQKVTVTQLRGIETKMQSTASRIEKSFAGLGISLRGGIALATAAVAASFTAMAKSAITDAAAIGDLADKLGVTTQQLQALQLGAVQANIDFGELESSLLRFSKAIGEAQNGQGAFLDVLRANGKELKGSYFENLKQFADLVRDAKNEQDALLLITQGFGKGNDEYLKFFEKGAAGLQALIPHLESVGNGIDEKLIRKAQQLEPLWANLMLSMKNNTQEAVLQMVADFEKIGNLEFRKGSILDYIFNGERAPAGRTRGGVPVKPPLSSGTNSPSELRGFPQQRGPETIVPNPEVEAARKKATADFVRDQQHKAEAIQKVIDAIELRTAGIGQSNVQQQIAIELDKAGTTADTAAGKRIVAAVQNEQMLQAAQESRLFAIEQIVTQQEEYAASLEYLAQAGVDAFSQWAIEGAKLSDVILDLGKSLLQAATQAALLGQGPLAGLFGTSAAGGGSGGLFGQLFGGMAGGGIAPHQAGGGHVSAGRPYVVGENRPELFVPSQSGTIIPKLGGGATNVSVNVMNFGNDNVDVQRRNGSSGPTLDVMIGQKINQHIGSGQADTAMRTRHGITPQKVRR